MHNFLYAFYQTLIEKMGEDILVDEMKDIIESFEQPSEVVAGGDSVGENRELANIRNGQIGDKDCESNVLLSINKCSKNIGISSLPSQSGVNTMRQVSSVV